MIASEAPEVRRTRRIRRLAVITLVILVSVAVGIDVVAFVILSPRDRVTCGPFADELIMVYSRYPLAATCKTRRCDRICASRENPRR
jgi:hypothetical protein